MRVGLTLIAVFLLVACKKEFPEVQTQVLGHAGESIVESRSKFPPNTLESVKSALDLGANGVEVDVQMTSDGYLLAYHDQTLDENSTGTGCINAQTYADLQDVTVYNSDTKLQSLNDIADHVLSNHVHLFLDVKHFNECTGGPFDYSLFNSSLNDLLSSYTNEQKELITINCRNQYLFDYLTDTLTTTSLESDDPEFALSVIENKGLDMLTIKLKAMNQAVQEHLDAKGISLTIYNVKTRSEVYKALEFDPEFVISDNIECTLKAING